MYVFVFSHTTLDYEVACLDVTPLVEGAAKADFVAVGLWTDISARILKLPDFTEVMKEALGGGMITCMHYTTVLLTI